MTACVTRWQCARGWTLQEMLLCCALVAVLATLSVPGLGLLRERYRVQHVTETFARHLALARYEAVNQGMSITVCPSDDGQHCGGSWTEGSLVFTDPDGSRTLDDGERILSALNPAVAGVNVVFRAFGVRSTLQFSPEGFTHQSGHFLFCPDNRDPELARQLVLSRSGRIREARDRDGDGIRDDASGQPLDCSG